MSNWGVVRDVEMLSTLLILLTATTFDRPQADFSEFRCPTFVRLMEGASTASKFRRFENFTRVIVSRDYETLKEAIDSGLLRTDLRNVQGTNLLMIAAQYGDLNAINILLSNPALRTLGATYPELYGKRFKRTRILKVLISEQDRSGKTAIDYARDGGHSEIVRNLLGSIQ